MPDRFSDEKDNHPSVEVPEEVEAPPISLKGIMKRLLRINKPECCPIFIGMVAVIMKALQVEAFFENGKQFRHEKFWEIDILRTAYLKSLDWLITERNDLWTDRLMHCLSDVLIECLIITFNDQ